MEARPPPPPNEAPEEWLPSLEAICMTTGSLRVALEWKYARDHPEERKGLEEDLEERITRLFALLKFMTRMAAQEGKPLPSPGFLKLIEEQLDLTVKDLIE